MTLQTTFEPLYAPYIEAAHQLHTYEIATYDALTSDTAKDLYKIIWILIQVIFWLSVLAAIYTLKWASDVNRLIHWVITYPDRCLASEEPSDNLASSLEPLEPSTADEISVTLENTQTSTNHTDTTLPKRVQTILNCEWTTTQKLRNIATFYGIRWRNARGEGKHLTNANIRAALAAYPAILTVL
ncbi:MAG: hypothetical protein ACFBSF_10150 [Leptolyngbyaceae cyanobacterium]